MKEATSSTPPTSSSGTSEASSSIATPILVDLRDPMVAGVLAWLWPGAGHLYQRRYAKGILFMACILGVYFFGLAMAEGRSVYASWNAVEKRWQFPLQMGTGLPATPAILQALRLRSGGKPLFGGVMAPPRDAVELSLLHERLNTRFEMGTLYTVIAGLLNILAIYDAAAGPGGSEPAGPNSGPPIKTTSDNKRKK